MAAWKNPGRDPANFAAIKDLLGANTANNSQASGNVVPNQDGSIYERLEYIQDVTEDPSNSSGAVFYVDSTHADTSDSNSGLSWNLPLATIDAGIGKCTASSNDIVYVAAGHAETVTAAITLDVVGVTIIGLGQGLNRPFISCATISIDEMTITAANCIVQNIGFNENTGTTPRTSFINVAAADVIIKDCWFDMGAYDTEAITVATAGDRLSVIDCKFNVTANGPDAAIELEGTSSDLLVRGCLFDGGSDTNAWDAAAINSTTAIKGATIENCDFRFCLTAQEFITLTAITEPPIIRGCTFKSGAGLVSQLNEATTFYVDSTKGADVAGAGTTRHTPAATLDHAVGLCSADAGDTIILAANHTETVTTAAPCAVDVAGVTIIGEGNGANRPTISLGTNTAATITVSAADVRMENILFSNAIDACASMLTVSGADFTAENVETRDTGAVECVTAWTITGDRCTINNYVHVGEGSGDSAESIIIGTDIDRLKVTNFNIKGMSSAGIIQSKTTACTNVEIHDGYMYLQEAAAAVGITLLSGDSGWIGPNVNIRLTDDNTDPFAAISSASNVNFVGPITVAAGDDEAAIDISSGLAVEADQALVMTPYGAARVVTEAQTLATATVPIFTPSVGRSLIVGLYCEVTTEVGAACDIIVRYTTTAAGNQDWTALSAIDGSKVNEFWGVTGDYLDLVSPGVARMKTPIIVDGGHDGVTIGVVGSEANSDTGVLTWTCLYVPLERGALITAAA